MRGLAVLFGVLVTSACVTSEDESELVPRDGVDEARACRTDGASSFVDVEVVVERNVGPRSVEGTIVKTTWTERNGAVDTANVRIDMPSSVRALKARDRVRVVGELVPGPAAVIRSTQAPCGFVDIDGKRHR